MRRVSGTLNRDAFAYKLLEDQIEQQEKYIASLDKAIVNYQEHLDRALADADTARKRADSLRDTLSRLEKPRG
jgi:septation ring formation regulator EzrA